MITRQITDYNWHSVNSANLNFALSKAIKLNNYTY